MMSSINKPALITFWHFECPGCGYTDAEVGRPVDFNTIHCEICREDGQTVRLKRWPVDPGAFARRRAA